VRIRDLLATYGKAITLRVAAELNCGGADSKRLLALAEREHERFVAQLSAASRAAIEQEIVE
jgi:hypothetical protein